MANRGRKANDALRVFLLAHWEDMTDREIENATDYPLRTIRYVRAKMGLKREVVRLPEGQAQADWYNNDVFKKRAIEEGRERRVLEKFKRTGLYDVKD